jgi:sarcosine oxidase subunit alpha
VAKGRKQLVGLLTEDGSLLQEGAQIVLDPNQPKPMKMVGHVTSSYQSTMGHPIAMAVIEGGFDKMGETVFIPMPDGVRKARVTSTVFYDPDNTRLKA